MLPMEEPASTLRTVHNRMYPKYQTLVGPENAAHEDEGLG